MGTSLKEKEFTPRGSKFFPLRVVPYDMKNHFYHIRWTLLNVTISIFITHMCNGSYVNEEDC